MEKIYLRDVLETAWASRFFVAISVVVSLLIALFLLISARPQYEATVTLVPTHANQYASQPGGGGAGLASSFAGQLLGVGESKDAQSTDQFVELMKSPFVAGLIDRRYHIVQHIFAGQWDEAGRRWIEPSGMMAGIKKAIKAFLHRPMWMPPGPYEASVAMSARTVVDISSDGGMVHISIRDADPAYGVFLLNTLYATTDDLLRERAKQRNDDHIAYIQRQLSSVNNTENRQSLAALLTAELGQQLLINSNAPFVLEKLSPTIVSPTPVSPKSFTYLVAGIFCGVMMGFGLFLLNNSTMFLERLRDQLRAKLGRN